MNIPDDFFQDEIIAENNLELEAMDNLKLF